MSEEQAKPAAAKKGGSRVIVIVVSGVLVVGAAVAGSLFGPRVLGAQPAAAVAPPADGSAKAEAGPAGEVINFQPIVVDVHDKEGVIHHLKVGLAIEMPHGKVEADLKNYTPRGREAAIALLRSKEWDEITSAKLFEAVKKDLSDHVSEAIGKERVSRVLVTDFVAQ
jgi:flagellar basal body-associated protein FliL